MIARPLPLAIRVKDSEPPALSDVALYAEPGAPELLSFKAGDGSLVTFFGTKDENAVTTSVTSMSIETPAP